MRRTIADVAVQDEKRRVERVLDAINVVGITNPQHVPAIRKKSCRHIFRERDIRVPFDGDVVVVPDPAKIVETEMSGQCAPRRRTNRAISCPCSGEICMPANVGTLLKFTDRDNPWPAPSPGWHRVRKYHR